ncbi:MAG: nickel pincer cofactor biosynthesis protein LarC [Desulfosporosinus sp.]|nr:nickel pincer cofactor biosynthesis protein LarC [Desulfosporosinus sp.]
MRIAYFHCFAGISGDMTLGALVDAGLDWEQLKSDLAKLPLTGYQLQMEKVIKQGISGTKVHVLTEEDHVHRHLRNVQEIISNSTLPEVVKEKSIQVFTRLAEAEAKVHQTTIERIHFHEVGAMDAIIDIVGSVIGLWRLGIEEVYASPVHTGTGFTECAHGIMPVPAPATMELLQGVSIYSRDIEKELVTPTGAAIITAYCTNFGSMPPMRVDNIGYGAGEHDLVIPNLLRLTIGEKVDQVCSDGHIRYGGKGDVHQGQALMMEANIDDMNPEFYDYLINKFLKAGAMDVFLRKIQMKKNRPAIVLSLLIHTHQLETFYQQIFAETTSIGVRVYPVTKYMLPYEIRTVQTKLGQAKVKVARYQDSLRNVAPEYEDCRKLAEEQQIPLKEVYDIIKYEAHLQLEQKDHS